LSLIVFNGSYCESSQDIRELRRRARADPSATLKRRSGSGGGWRETTEAKILEFLIKTRNSERASRLRAGNLRTREEPKRGCLRINPLTAPVNQLTHSWIMKRLINSWFKGHGSIETDTQSCAESREPAQSIFLPFRPLNLLFLLK